MRKVDWLGNDEQPGCLSLLLRWRLNRRRCFSRTKHKTPEKALALDPQFCHGVAHWLRSWRGASGLWRQGEAASGKRRWPFDARFWSEKDKLFITAWQATAERNPYV
ncbi:MAG: hypothetical protein U0Y68_13100 [Blastocatellia bacterium]